MTSRDAVRKKASKCDLTSNQAEAKNITLMDLCACHGILYRMKAYILLQTALLPPPPPHPLVKASVVPAKPLCAKRTGGSLDWAPPLVVCYLFLITLLLVNRHIKAVKYI